MKNLQFIKKNVEMVSYPCEVGQFWEPFETGQSNLDEAERFKSGVLIAETFDLSRPSVVQIQLFDL